ncbi:DUF6503 family protein [Robertkochia sediminum]|uniref:DUF6503 family protein n=1 Tax=Robertkochia sediminum TaxID=2785326 RepID=UPI0019328FC1|nr:DUF6503 family protein [Robertkochia sediminum]MBL7473421.1 deoxyribose-phosphate aldolase [Robertkochia sediminum]
MKNMGFLLLLSIIVLSCAPKAEDIVAKAIENAGGHAINGREIEFDFRDKHYRSVHKDGRFLLERSYDKDSAMIRDVLTNDHFERFVNDSLVQVPDSMAVRYSNSVNSVHYFAYLPYGLDGAAVNKELLAEVNVKGKSYYKVKVSFDQEGGGTDFEDVFIYWISKDHAKVDYLAYEYHTNGGGMRFREAYNRRTIGGIDFVDYRNYKPSSLEYPITVTDSLFEAGALELLSVIALENVMVSPCGECN